MKIKQRTEKLSDNVKVRNKVVVDTNILIRALIDDNAELSKTVANTDEVHIPLPIFFETVFVLEKLYKLPREVIIDYISTITSYDNVLTDKDGLREILDTYSRKNKLSIIDCFLTAYAYINNLEIRTLDKALERY
jgi:predicted nucleic-acid-binding protein